MPDNWKYLSGWTDVLFLQITWNVWLLRNHSNIYCLCVDSASVNLSICVGLSVCFILLHTHSQLFHSTFQNSSIVLILMKSNNTSSFQKKNADCKIFQPEKEDINILLQEIHDNKFYSDFVHTFISVPIYIWFILVQQSL